MPRNWFGIFALLSAVLYSAASIAQAPPSADTYVSASQPAINFGTSAFLPVQAGATSYIRLNLGAFPANASIAKATLRLYVNAVAAPGSFDVYQVGSNWVEKSVTSNNAPSLESSATGGHPVSVTAASANQFILIDITELAQSWLNGSTPNYGIALALTSVSGSFSFDSKESTGTGHQPELEVILAGEVGAVPGIPTEGAVPPDAKNRAGQPNSDPYIDNGTALQVGGNFNIDGNGSAATFNATSQYLLGGVPVMGITGDQGFFVGTQTGPDNTGAQNIFRGNCCGSRTTRRVRTTYSSARPPATSNTTGQSNCLLALAPEVATVLAATTLSSALGPATTTPPADLNNFVGTGAGTGQHYRTVQHDVRHQFRAAQHDWQQQFVLWRSFGTGQHHWSQQRVLWSGCRAQQHHWEQQPVLSANQRWLQTPIRRRAIISTLAARGHRTKAARSELAIRRTRLRHSSPE